MPDQPPGLAPRQFERVGVALLGHQAAAGAITLVQADEAEGGIGEDDQVFGQAAEMHAR